jgi:hypothetical protein
MAISAHFYHKAIRNYTAVFGTLFNGMTIIRTGGQEITVPIKYGNKELWYNKLIETQNPENQEVGITAPILGFNITSLQYDNERKQGNLAKFTTVNVDDSKLTRSFAPQPITIDYTLSLYVENVDDGLQIIEQIIPFFKPSYNVTMKEMDGTVLDRDIPIVLTSVTPPDMQEGGFVVTRILIWTLEFSVQGQIYGPEGEGSIIKEVIVNSHLDLDADGNYSEEIASRYNVQPDPTSAIATDDYGFTEVWTEYPTV